MTTLCIEVPSWVDDLVTDSGASYATDDARMGLAVALAAQNVARGGGPFGAAVFAGDRCVAAGVNRVLATGYSIAHAEIVALTAAQHAASVTGTTLTGSLALFTSAEPCCQCFGAIVWSGIDRLVCAATTDAVEAIGFDEGPKPAQWQDRLRERGIQVDERVQWQAAVDVLQAYQARGGTIYGLRGSLPPAGSRAAIKR